MTETIEGEAVGPAPAVIHELIDRAWEANNGVVGSGIRIRSVFSRSGRHYTAEIGRQRIISPGGAKPDGRWTRETRSFAPWQKDEEYA